jgi:glutamine amidotransferase
MQLLFESSEEAPDARGLGWFAGSVRRFATGRTEPETGKRLKVPHMGWNEVESRHPMFGEDRWYYFVHSYHCVPDDEALVVGQSDYGGPFCAAVARDGVLACQFHPEKSHRAGQALLRAFMEVPCS